VQGLPFAACDFFAYVVPGALCLFFWDLIFNNRDLYGAISGKDSCLWLGISAILIAYLVGQIIADPANVLTSLRNEMTLRKRPVLHLVQQRACVLCCWLGSKALC